MTTANGGEPTAYFLTWSCYGAWLHGDPRGSVCLGRNAPGTEHLPADPALRHSEARRMGGEAVTLDAAAREIVRSALEEHARTCGWEVYAINVRTNHVHVVAANAGMTPERMMASLKAWATRRLREAWLVGAADRVWTRHGSTRYLWDEPGVAAAVAYVVEGQDVPR